MGERIRVLLIDDDEAWVTTTAQLLESEHEEFVVWTATTAGDGLDALHDIDADCVVSDYRMPDMDGVAFLSRVREEYPDLPFILVTGKGSESVASEAISKQVTDYLSKDPTQDQIRVLANRITNAVRTYRTERALAALNRKIQGLHEVAAELGRAESRQEAFDRAVTGADQALSFDRCYVWEVVGDEAVLRADAGTDLSIEPPDWRVADDTHNAAVFRGGDSAVLDDCTGTADCAFPDPVHSVLSVPIGDHGLFQAVATEPGVFDEHDREVAGLLVSHLTAALDRLVSRELLSEERDRLAALFDNLPEPALHVVYEGDEPSVKTVNPAFDDQFEADPGTVVADTIDRYVEDGRFVGSDDVRESPPTLTVGGTGSEPIKRVVEREVTHHTAEGLREFLFRGVFVEYDRAVEAYGIYTDITEQKERERAVRRERDSKEAIREVLVTSSTREGIERAFCEQVTDVDGVRFAWVAARRGTGELVPRTAAGDDDGYFDAIVSADAEVVAAEPTARAARTREAVRQFVADSDERWATEAASRGISAVSVFPLEHNDVPYGVLGVYVDDPAVFEDERRTVLSDLRESLAYAIGAAERRTALMAEQIVEVGIHVTDPDYYLNEISRSLSRDHDGSLTVAGTLPQGDDAILTYLDVEGVDSGTVTAALEAVAAIRAVEPIEVTDDGGRFQLLVDAPTPCSLLADHGGAVGTITVANGGTDIVAEFKRESDIESVIDAIRDQYDGIEMSAYRLADRPTATDRPVEAGIDALTDRQREVLETAYHAGYFERPRAQSANEVAETLGISRATFLQHLRVAQRKVFQSVFE